MKFAMETYQMLKKVIKEKYGVDGGFAPNISTGDETLELLQAINHKAGHDSRTKVSSDTASEFYKDNKYGLDFKKPEPDPINFSLENNSRTYTPGNIRSWRPKIPSICMIGRLVSISLLKEISRLQEPILLPIRSVRKSH
ncbi:Enolase, C-terminal TIM barrel domain-containing protein [Crucibulum laeve]|uniref:phosphopyruvate hydratase n=1 Tax=Crucibulum laeve TaxID=68775 RepID=A0A5C3M9G9_9AGAR|nr:Enolase, C-terminal TIM barrel domain-containing protein [Crucibulum laeve]